jgi:hypothetical protein
MSYREAYFAVPMVLTVASQNATASIVAADFAPNTSATSADYAVGLKSWFGQMIHSFTLDLQGTTIIQQTPFINMWNSFKLVTSLSMADVITQGSTIGFYPDDPLSWTFSAVAGSLSGQGVCNNSNQVTSGQPASVVVWNQYKSGAGNLGYLSRQMYINYDTAGVSGDATFAGLLTGAQATQVWKSFIFTKVNAVAATSQGVFQIAIMATIYLKHIHSFFQMIPLLKGQFLKMTMNLNNTSTSFSRLAGARNLTITSVSNSVGGVNPLMIASAAVGCGAAAAAFGGTTATDTLFKANISVGAVCLDSQLASTAGVAQAPLSRSIYLYVPAMTFNPVFEQAYLSSPIKSIKYTDVYQYQISNISAANGQVNQLLTNGIAGIKSVLILPFYSVAGGSANTGIPTGIPVYQSPFDPAGTGPTSPLALLTNFNIVVSGQNAIYNTQRYNFEQFNNQLYGANAVNGGMTDGLTSGLINSLGFEMEYAYYYVDVSRMLPVEESVPKSVQVVGMNTCAKALDLWCFIEYSCGIDIDSLTGSRV